MKADSVVNSVRVDMVVVVVGSIVYMEFWDERRSRER